MIESNKFENYPWWILILSNALSLSIYGLGFMIMIRLGWIISIIYLIYISILEYRLIRNHCPNCFYWGKTCGFGKGRLSAILFKKGDAAKFCLNEFSWKDLIPDLLISLIPFITGIVLMIIKFDYMILIAVILLVLLSTKGNEFIRGKLTCRYCKQKELGCPAEELFNKNKT
jgi:uncharacterized membrane protein